MHFSTISAFAYGCSVSPTIHRCITRTAPRTFCHRKHPSSLPICRTMSHLQATGEDIADDGDLSKKLSQYQTREQIPNDRIFFIELGFGNDSHGQSSTKATVRACRNAIEFNSIPSIQRLLPDGGYDALKLDVLLAIPPKYQAGLDLDAVANVFPYGNVRFEIQDGGMVAPSGIAIQKLGDLNDDMVVVCASVTVGH